MMNKQIISNIEQARNWAHAGDIEKMCMHLEYAKKGCDAENIASENIAKMIDIVERCGKAINFHHRLLDDAQERFDGNDHATMALKYAKFGLLDMMGTQVEKANVSIQKSNKESVQKKELSSELGFVQASAHKIACYRDLATAIVLAVKKKENAMNFVESAKGFAEKSGIEVKEHTEIIERFIGQ